MVHTTWHNIVCGNRANEPTPACLFCGCLLKGRVRKSMSLVKIEEEMDKRARLMEDELHSRFEREQEEMRVREARREEEMKRQEEERAKLEAMALAEALARDAMPDEYVCPITQELMVDPVTCADGHSYERTAILQWLEKHDTSPKTGLELTTKQVFPAIALRNLIVAFREANPGIEV